MTPVPLADLRLRPSHHLSALSWIGLLYRKPSDFNAAMKALPRIRAVGLAFVLLLNVLPYMLVLAFVGRMLLTLSYDPALSGAGSSGIIFWIVLKKAAVGIAVGIASGIASWIIVGIAAGISAGVAGVIAFGIAFGISAGIAGGSALAIAGGIATGVAGGIAAGIAGVIAFGIAAGIAVGIALGIAFGIAVGIFVGISAGIAVGIAGGIGFVIFVLRAYYYPAHLFFIWPEPIGNAYPRHPAAWDDLCSLPFIGLHRLLVAYRGLKPEAGDLEIERLIDTYPSQRMEALTARTILIARAAANEPDLAKLDQRVAGLPDGEKGFLKDTPTVRGLVGEIAEIQRRLDTIQRRVFREPLEAQLRKTIETFQHRVSGLNEPLASEFRAAAERWKEIAGREHDRTVLLVKAQPTLQVFRAGDPVDRANEAFIPRYPVIEALDAQIMLATGCPGLLLYGRRRMGKSTLLRNLPGFIDASVVPAYFSMQDPAAFSSQASFVEMLQTQVCTAAPAFDGYLRAGGSGFDGVLGVAAPEVADGLDGLYRWLGEVDAHLKAENRRLLLAFDEFEMIDRKIGEGVFSPDLLALVRESVQSHRRIIWLFAGSHGIEELKHAEWPSYFVSLRTIEVPPFTREETQLLLTEPLKFSPLYRARESEAPRFDPTFWGENGIAFVHEQAGGWPHLVQLLAETAIDLANERGLPRVDEGMLAEVCGRAIVSGDAVLRQLVERECGSDAEWDYLLAFRAAETQPPPTDDRISRALRRRLLVVKEGGLWRLRVPLMRRWLIDRA